ncbi:hypothetical protein K0504_17020 [Neiella marina]|uniref:Uncharacterized protein n=1 Tax=Neiella holothuriorum TaxID=2870530 RepID=A0ABS7EM35_9GAMM|nr:hypothetical protein [Neiella holothuriorum]MBW8192742.1 hypothetical protein [Neiella holothuriorum]
MPFKYIKYDMPITEAEAFVEQYADELSSIWRASSPASGDKGWAWRQLWGRPQDITPITLFLRQQVEYLKGDRDQLSKEEQKQRQKLRRQQAEFAKRESEQERKLAEQADEIAQKDKKISRQQDQIKDLKAEIKEMIDESTCAALVQSIDYLVKLVNSPIDLRKLPHYQKLSKEQLAYLKKITPKE